MICPNCGNDMGNSMYCSNCNTYPFKDKESYDWKKAFKTMGITIGISLACIAVLVVIFIGIDEFNQKKEYNEEISTKYEEISEEYSDKEYYSALSHIKELKDD